MHFGNLWLPICGSIPRNLPFLQLCFPRGLPRVNAHAIQNEKKAPLPQKEETSTASLLWVCGVWGWWYRIQYLASTVGVWITLLMFFLVPPLPSHCAYPHLRHCIVCKFCCICSSLCAPLLFHSGRWGFPIQLYNEECKAGTSRSRSRIHSKVLIAISLLNCSVCSLILYVSD